MGFNIAVLISGNGSNLQAIIDQIEAGKIAANISVVISNEPTAYGLERASKHGIETKVICHRDYADREKFDQELLKTLSHYQPDLIVLAGFMRILSPIVIEPYRNKIINIHPSLLPKHRGLDTHKKVLDAKEKIHGTTVHYVTAELDDGPILGQAHLKVRDKDTVKTLEEKVKQLEYILYPTIIKWLVEERIKLEGNKVCLEGKVLKSHGYQLPMTA